MEYFLLWSLFKCFSRKNIINYLDGFKKNISTSKTCNSGSFSEFGLSKSSGVDEESDGGLIKTSSSPDRMTTSDDSLSDEES